jgi:hypothetical protein
MKVGDQPSSSGDVEGSNSSDYEEVVEIKKVKKKQLNSNNSHNDLKPDKYMDKSDNSKKGKKKNRSGKGRLESDEALGGGMNIGLPQEELKRKRQDDALVKAEMKSKTKSSKNSEESSGKGSKFGETERKAMLYSISKEMDVQEAAKDFFVQMPMSTRTEGAVKKKYKEVREGLEKSLLALREDEIERNGMFEFTLILIFRQEFPLVLGSVAIRESGD